MVIINRGPDFAGFCLKEFADWWVDVFGVGEDGEGGDAPPVLYDMLHEIEKVLGQYLKENYETLYRRPDVRRVPPPYVPAKKSVRDVTVGPIPKPGEHIVYCHYDTNHQPLYIGVTSNYKNRQETHRSHARWWSEVDHIWAGHLDFREEAEEAEKIDIKEQQPLHNKVGR